MMDEDEEEFSEYIVKCGKFNLEGETALTEWGATSTKEDLY